MGNSPSDLKDIEERGAAYLSELPATVQEEKQNNVPLWYHKLRVLEDHMYNVISDFIGNISESSVVSSELLENVSKIIDKLVIDFENVKDCLDTDVSVEDPSSSAGPSTDTPAPNPFSPQQKMALQHVIVDIQLAKEFKQHILDITSTTTKFNLKPFQSCLRASLPSDILSLSSISL